MKVARKSIIKGKLILCFVTIMNCIQINHTASDRGGDAKTTDTKCN